MPRRRPLLRVLMVGGWALGAALFLAACGATTPMSTTDTYGTHAQRILDLLIPIAWAGLAVFVVVEAILIYSVLRFRQKSTEGLPVQIHGNTTIEVLWTIAPALIVLVIAVLTFRTQAANAEFSPTALQVRAVGNQWWFGFEYPEQGVTTANEMYIPVGRDVTVVLDGGDVIHNFWVPKLAGKTYMIPGNTNYITFRADQEGIYRGQCAEFCGEAHALMKFRVVAVQQAVFDQWVAAQKAIPAEASGTFDESLGAQFAARDDGVQRVPGIVPIPASVYGGDAANGKVVFNQKGCIGCHVIAGNERAVGKIGPNLTNFGDRTTLAAGLIPNTPENLYRWLHDPGTIKPGNKMAAQIRPGTLSEQEIKDLIAYLELQRTEIPLPAPR